MKTRSKHWVTSSLFGIEIDCLGHNRALELIQQQSQSTEPHHWVTMNAEMVDAATEDGQIHSLLNAADVVLPDGIGVVWALNRQGVSVERVPGIELVKSLLQTDIPLAILGSHPDTLEAFHQILPHTYPQANVVFSHHGYFSESEEPDILDQLQQSGARVLLVALGVPRQEQWIQVHKATLNIPVMMGVGGSFDVISGRLQRAPELMQAAKLEWLFRLIQQPSRWRRMLALPRFVKKVVKIQGQR